MSPRVFRRPLRVPETAAVRSRRQLLAWQRRLASTGPAAHSRPHALWVRDHLQHLGAQAQAITAPATRLAGQRRVPWWR
jgi:hypothetical protein